MKLLGTEDMDLAAPPSSVMSREIRCKEVIFDVSATPMGPTLGQSEDKLVTKIKPTLQATENSVSGKKRKTNKSVVGTVHAVMEFPYGDSH